MLFRLALPLLVLFLVAFPKAGIKISEVPVTFGYLLVFGVAAIAATRNAVAGRYSTLPRPNFICFAASLPLVAFGLLFAVSNGGSSIGFIISFFVSFSLFPLLFLVALAPQRTAFQSTRLLMLTRRAVSFAAVFGLVQFVYVFKTGNFIEVPYLTVNAGDVGRLSEKNIYRGDGIYKLISTYNNGNIYGVATLMLLPLYDGIQRSMFWRLLVRLALFLTLSRTVWFGLAVYEVIRVFYIQPLRTRSLLIVAAALTLAAAVVVGLLTWIGQDLTFLIDPNLGGRADVLSAVSWQMVPDGPIDFPSEIVAASIVSAFGLVGLAAFLLSTLAPVVMLSTSRARRSIKVKTAIAGMAMLHICGLSDGPILLIPVMAFYWALAAIGLAEASPQTQPNHSL